MEENEKHLKEENLYECKLRGSLKVKNNKLNCIIGDIVEFDKCEKVITSIYERKNFLHRPLLSNIDYIGILFSIKSPNFDFTNFQKMLLNANEQDIPVLLIISKIDLVSQEELVEFLQNLNEIFSDNHFPIFAISIKENIGLDDLKRHIQGKSITVSGPSGSGKSSLINHLLEEEILETNEISNKTSRGRHTTTESRFFKIDENTFIIDTPGFSSIDFPKLKNKKDLEKLFPDFLKFSHNCKFRDCIHLNEPNCAIKENVEKGNISKVRYDFYLYSLNHI